MARDLTTARTPKTAAIIYAVLLMKIVKLNKT